MSAEADPHTDTEAALEDLYAEPEETDDEPASELESSFLTLVLFGGLVLFAVGCMIGF